MHADFNDKLWQYCFLLFVFNHCIVHIFYHTILRFSQCVYLWSAPVWAVSVFHIWKGYIKISDICNSVSVISVLSVALHNRPEQEPLPGDLSRFLIIVYSTFLWIFSYGIEKVSINGFVRVQIWLRYFLNAWTCSGNISSGEFIIICLFCNNCSYSRLYKYFVHVDLPMKSVYLKFHFIIDTTF